MLPSPTNKWSTTTHLIKGEIFGFINSTISYQHFYFHQGCLLHTKAFAVSTTLMTVGNGGKLKGNTKLDNATGHTRKMTKKEYTTFAVIVLCLRPSLQHGTRQTKHSLLNMLLDDFVTLTNPTTVYPLDEPPDKRALACILAHFSLLMLGADALTPAIVERFGGTRQSCAPTTRQSKGRLSYHLPPPHLACMHDEQHLPPVAQHSL